MIKLQDILCKLKLLNYEILITIIFKEELPKAFEIKLKENQYEIINLPKNPFL